MRLKHCILPLIFSCTSAPLLANPSAEDQQIKMMLSMMESMGELDRLADCIGLPPAKVKTIIQKSMKKCGIPDMETEDPAHTACIQAESVSASGISANEWESCDQDSQTNDPIMAQLDALYARIGDREPSPQEEQQINALLNQMQENGLQEMNQMVQGMIKGSQGSEGSISLPQYPGAQLLIHIPAQGNVEFAGKSYQTLPGASFVTTSKPQDVVSFYQAQLPSYKVIKPSLLPQDTIIIKDVPANFDYVRDMARAFSIPHIHIQAASKNEQQYLPGAKTLFFIYYP